MKREDWLDTVAALKSMAQALWTVVKTIVALSIAIVLACIAIWCSCQMYMNYPSVTMAVIVTIPFGCWFAVNFAIAREQRELQEIDAAWRAEKNKPAHLDLTALGIKE
jgi:hypothetical protein